MAISIEHYRNKIGYTSPDGRAGGRAAGLLENKAKTQPAGA